MRQVVNDAGTVLDRIDHDAFGNVTSETNPAQAPPFGFQGGFRDLVEVGTNAWFNSILNNCHEWVDRRRMLGIDP